MQIVLPGALPDPREARELTSYLLKAAPTLVHWLEQSSARQVRANTQNNACTPYEQWQLDKRGFMPDAGQNLAAGLGPLWAGNATRSNETVWLAELVHVSPSRDGAALLPASELAITADQSVALFESAQAMFESTGFTLQACDTQRWRIMLPQDFAPDCASPVLVSLTSVNDWWPQDNAARPWRRLVNELQMSWFDHPVNLARYQQGLAPINSLWLFGGARGDQFHKPPARGDVQVHADLVSFFTARDWGGWIAAMGELEARIFQPVAGDRVPELVLLGHDKIIELKPTGLRRWTQWLPGSRDSWRKWWSPQD